MNMAKFYLTIVLSAILALSLEAQHKDSDHHVQKSHHSKKQDGLTWSPRHFPDLKSDVSKCSRVASRYLAPANGFPVLVCDPDELFTNEEALSLENELREVLAVPVQFTCPCSTFDDLSKPGAPTFKRNCPPDTGDDTFMVAVAAMKKMSSKIISEHGKEEETDSKLRAARAFADELKKKWFKGTTRCGEIFIVLYSADDNVLYITAGQAAHEKVPNDKLKDILISVRPMFPGDPVAGIRHIVNRLKFDLKEDAENFKN